MNRKITLIAALSQNQCIGVNNTMPWHLPEDLAFFKQYTLNKTVIMGRKTWDSLPFKPLPNRRNIVISHQPQWQHPQAEHALSLTAALNACADDKEVIIMGGASIYAAALPLATDLRLTELPLTIEGDAFFPHWSSDEWRLVERIKQFSAKTNLDFAFVHWQRMVQI